VTTRTCPVCGEQHEELELMSGWRLLACPHVGAGDLVTTGGLVSTENVVAELRQQLTNAEGRERVWAEQWAAVRDEAHRLRDALEYFARRLEWSACVLAPEAIDARSWARELRRVLDATASQHGPPPACAPPGGPVVVEASGVEVVGTTKPGGDA
jgi:hypothetical protein